MRNKIRNLLRQVRGIFSSIRFRLALWFVVILGLVMLAFSVFIYTRQAHELQRETVDRLEGKIRQLQSLEQFTRREPFEGQISIPNISQGAGPLLQENDVLAVANLSGQVVQNYGPITSNDLNQLTKTVIGSGSNQGPINYELVSATATGQNATEDYIFLVGPITFGPNVIGYLILGSPVDPGGQLQRLLFTLLLGGLGTLGLALAGGYWLADRAMRPVKTISQTARQIGESDLSRRLNLGTQDELGQMANTFDQMLSRLQAAFERQRQFTADASHELRTPLTIVNLEAGRALATKRSVKDYERALKIIQSENDFMTRLVNNLLTLSRMDAGQTALNFEELDLSDLTLDVVERLEPLAGRNSVRLVPGELPELKLNGDRQYLTQMITNLVENAIKYGGVGACVCVETGFDSQGQKPVGWLRVEDDGPGIPVEHLPHLFDRFYQVDKARTRNPQEGEDDSGGENASAGSGLGLSIVSWIAKAHGGEVTVQSEVGKGTIFMVEFPLVGGI